MLDKDFFSDIDKRYYKDQESLYLYTDVDLRDKSEELILNDNTFDYYTAMNRNISVMANKLFKKMPRNKSLDITNIEGGPLGFVLISDGSGNNPYWENPTKVQEMLKTIEIVNQEYFILDSVTLKSDLFTSLVNCSVTNNITFTGTGSLFLKPYTINNTGSYSMEMTIKPTILDLVKSSANEIVVRDLGLVTGDKYLAITERGPILLENVQVSVSSNMSLITTTSYFSTAYKVYCFSGAISVDIFSTSRNFKTAQFEDIYINNDRVIIKYSTKECSGNKLEMQIFGRKGDVIEKIQIKLNTTVL